VGPEEGLNYLYRKKITVDAGEIDGDCAADIPNFPLLVTLTGTDFTDIENDVDANGYGLNFKAEDDAVCGGPGTAPCVLDHEIELYDTDNDKLVAWVRIPSLDFDDNTVIYLHYGNPNVTVSTENAAGVWDANFKGVWHLSEATDATNIDSTSNPNDGTPSDSPVATTGKIAGALTFRGDSDTRVGVGTDGSLDLSLHDSWTISAWVEPAADITSSTYPIIYTYGFFRAGLDFAVLEGPADGLIEHCRWESGAGWLYSDTAMDIDAWNHVVVVRDPTTTYFYLNGEPDGSDDSVTIIQDNYGSFIGGGEEGADLSDFSGLIDEVRISDTDRDACWIGTEHSNQKSSSTLISVDPEESWTFDHYKTITIDQGSVGDSCSADLADFPVMIHIDGDDFDDIADDVDADGYDIIFKDANGNQLAHEIEKYDEDTDNELIAWVKMPVLSETSDTVITIHYGNSDIDTATANPAGVWSTDYCAVYHLNENPGATGAFSDSTANNYHGTNLSTTNADGVIGDGQDFSGSSQYIDLGNNRDFATAASAVTLSGWFQFDTVASSNDLISISVNNGGTPTNSSRMNLTRSNSELKMLLKEDDGAGDFVTTTTSPLATGVWYHVAGVADFANDFAAFYVNGVSQAIDLMPSFTNTATANTSSASTAIGAEDDGSFWYANGRIDEVRIANTVRDLCWIQTEFANQDAPASFYGISPEMAFTTAIDLLSFTATGANDAVQVAWETASETGNLGFYLYRADSPAGPYSRITDQLIAGLNFSPAGRTYTYQDTDVTQGQAYYYKLEDLDMDGQRTFHGPVGVDWDGGGAPAVAGGDPDPAPWQPGGEAGPVTVAGL